MRRYDVTDADLLQQVAHGDDAALRELWLAVLVGATIWLVVTVRH